jgi:hypothetical protein
MTESESKEVLLQALAAFPGVSATIKANSPNPAETIRMWAKSLESLERSEVESVIARWCTGQLEAPEGYKKENFHLHIRAVVMADRAKAARERTRETTLKQHTRTGKSFYKAILGPFMVQVLAVQKQYIDGMIGFEERDERIAALVASTSAKVDREANAA